jgi:small subunit ribosomal protein S20
MRLLLKGKDKDGAVSALPKTFSVIDRAAKTGIIKRNTAARYKSRLSARVKALAAA